MVRDYRWLPAPILNVRWWYLNEHLPDPAPAKTRSSSFQSPLDHDRDNHEEKEADEGDGNKVSSVTMMTMSVVMRVIIMALIRTMTTMTRALLLRLAAMNTMAQHLACIFLFCPPEAQ